MDANSVLGYQRNGLWSLTDEHFFHEGRSTSFDAYIEVLCTGHFEVNARSGCFEVDATATGCDWDGTFDTFKEATDFVNGLYVAWMELCRKEQEVAA
jgi:hypothetical protein